MYIFINCLKKFLINNKIKNRIKVKIKALLFLILNFFIIF